MAPPLSLPLVSVIHYYTMGEGSYRESSSKAPQISPYFYYVLRISLTISLSFAFS